ncbi:hypothetical protein HDV63DRAFT_362262 [Trichoderma sp. SZMC 28014]
MLWQLKALLGALFSQLHYLLSLGSPNTSNNNAGSPVRPKSDPPSICALCRIRQSVSPPLQQTGLWGPAIVVDHGDGPKDLAMRFAWMLSLDAYLHWPSVRRAFRYRRGAASI